jgi:hypothetical protein
MSIETNIAPTSYLTRSIAQVKRTATRRRKWMEQALAGRSGWKCDGIQRHFPGGRTCVCGRTVYNALVLKKHGMPDQFVGQTCALSALAFLTGGFRLVEQMPDQDVTPAAPELERDAA